MPDVKLGEHSLIIGTTGAGKTYFFQKFAKGWKRVLVIDTEDGYDFTEKNWHILNGADECVRYLYEFTNSTKPFRASCRLNSHDNVGLDKICRYLLEHMTNMLFYVDEVTDFSDPHYISPDFEKLIRAARKRRITVVVSSQRPQGISRWIYSNCAHKWIFYIQPDDAELCKKYMPKTVDSIELLHYKQYDFLYVGPDGKVTYYTRAE